MTVGPITCTLCVKRGLHLRYQFGFPTQTRSYGGRPKSLERSAGAAAHGGGPEADETKTMTVAWPHHACVPLSKRRQHRPARSTCADALGVRSSPLGAAMVCKSGNSSADALFTQGLMALMQPIVCCVRAQSAREFVTEFSGGATPHRSGVAQS